MKGLKPFNIFGPKSSGGISDRLNVLRRTLNRTLFTVGNYDVTYRDVLHFVFVILVLYGTGKLEKDQAEKFKIIWNVPSETCQDKHEIYFQQTLAESGISFNLNDRFFGEVSTIWYPGKFGLWPRFTQNTGPAIDGGVPQAGNLEAHLSQIEVNINARLPHRDFSGIAVINMEDWRPLWDRNWGFKTCYRTEAVRLVQQEPDYCNCTSGEQECEAKSRFERVAQLFMTESLRTARRLRPNGQWGYYHFPYCFNGKPPRLHCRPPVREGNDKMRWLWEESSGIFPSVYLFREEWPNVHKATYMYGNIEEGIRVARSVGGRPVYAYAKKKYDKSQPVRFYQAFDMMLSMRLPADFGINGVVIWGSMGDFLTAPKCQRQLEYLKTVIAPYAKKLLKFTEDCSRIICNGKARCVHRGSLDEAFAPEILYDSIEAVNDFTIDDRYTCQCADGSVGADCVHVELGGESSGTMNFSSQGFGVVLLAVLVNFFLSSE